MDLDSLSSNWKKLQATLKKSGAVSTSTSTTKRKVSDRDSGHAAVKKRKATEKEQPKIRETYISRKRKTMDNGVEEASSLTTSRRKSGAGVSTETSLVSRLAKVNEGRSPT